MNYIDSFVSYMANIKRLSDHTITNYQKNILDFEGYISNTYEIGLDNAKAVHLRDWVVSLTDTISNRSINSKIISVYSFYKYLERDHNIKSNIRGSVKLLKHKKNVQPIFTKELINDILDSINPGTDREIIRDKLILELLYATGCRLSELVNLEYKNVDLIEGYIKVTGKGNKDRIIPLTRIAIKQTKEYLQYWEPVIKKNNSKYLILTDSFNRTNQQHIYRVVKKYFPPDLCGLSASPHIFRRSMATHLLEEGAHLIAVKEILGHSSIVATQSYIINTTKRIKNIYERAHPKG
ncbi:MAG TPA: tyrosine-type recombinase/integrase [Cytophagaceae bacterium]